MRDKLSVIKRTEDMSVAIAAEAQEMVRAAAQPISAGEGVKAQIRRAWAALGRPPFWRVRAAWYGEAGEWSASALEDIRIRHAAWRRKQEAQGRAEAQEHIKRLSALRDHMAAADADFYRAEMSALECAIERMGSDVGAMAIREDG